MIYRCASDPREFSVASKALAAACAIAGIYLLSILVTGGYAVNFAGLRFNANKRWPAIVATLGFALLRTTFRHGSIKEARWDQVRDS